MSDDGCRVGQVNVISREVDEPFPNPQADKVHQVVDLKVCSAT